jgi:hypothetical protein
MKALKQAWERKQKIITMYIWFMDKYEQVLFTGSIHKLVVSLWANPINWDPNNLYSQKDSQFELIE